MWHTLSTKEVERKMGTNLRFWSYRKTSGRKKKKIWSKPIRRAKKETYYY